MRFLALILLSILVLGPGTGRAAVVTSAQPADRPMPDFPPAALNVAGHVTLQFGIGADGHTRDIHIIKSEPAGVFDQAALSAVSHWLYHPRLRNGRAEPQENNAVNLAFEPPKPEPIFKPTLDYPREAYAMHQEGVVTVAFDVTPLGSTTKVRVLKSSSPGVFDRSAISAVSGWQYAATPGGTPRLNQTADIAFTLADAQLAPIPRWPIRLAYPSAALAARIMGNCNVGYWIEADGTTSDAHVLSCTPSGYFEAATIDSVKRATYRMEAEPRLNQRRYHRVSVKFRFSGISADQISYLKPGQWVKLRFTRSMTGHAKSIEVIGQSSPDVPVAKAVEQLSMTTLAIATENGRPVEQPDSTIVISGGTN